MPGGIQHLLRRVFENSTRLNISVVAPAAVDADVVDSALGFRVRRAGTVGDRRVSIGAVNAIAAAEARVFRPDVVLSGHTVVSPGASAAGALARAPVVQYFYANEVGARPRLAARAANRASLSIVISRFTRTLVENVGGPHERLRLVTPGVDLPAAPPSDTTRDENSPVVLTVARIEERYKGHDVMTRALPLVHAQVPDAKWVVVGDGRLRATIEGLARANRAEHATHFTGPLNDDERDQWFRRAHVFAMPSRLPAARAGGEGFGIVYLEAGSHGLPVVGGNVGGALDAVQDGATGVLVDPTDHLAVADALTQLLRDPDRRRAMGEAGYAAAQAHSWPEIALQVEDVLFEAAGRSG